MSVVTKILKLFKYNSATDGSLTFNIDMALNDNWDKIDAAVEQLQTAPGDAVAAHNKSPSAHSDIRSAIGKKQDAINDLATIRSGAKKGETAVQESAVGKPSGVASLGPDGLVPSGQLPEISAVKTYTATIGTTWTEDENTGVKTQNVAISGVLASHTATIDHAYTGSGTSDDYAAFVEAENQYLTYITNGYAETYTGGVKITIFGDAPTVEIPIIVEVA